MLDFMKKFLLCLLITSLFGMSFATANENLKDVLSASGKLLRDSEDSAAVDVLKDRLKNIENSVVKNKAVQVVALALKASGDSSFGDFKNSIADYDFSKIDAEANPQAALKKQ